MNNHRLCIVPKAHPAAGADRTLAEADRIGKIAADIAMADSRCLLDTIVKAVTAGDASGYQRGLRDAEFRHQLAQMNGRRALYGQSIPDDPARTAGPGEPPGDAPIPADDDTLYPEDDHHPKSREHME
jgi:hypothetical protein